MARKEPIKIKLKRRKKELASEKMQNNPNQERGMLGMLATAGIGAGLGMAANTASQLIGRKGRNEKISDFNELQDSNESYNKQIAGDMRYAASKGLTSQNYSQAFKQIQPNQDKESGFNFDSMLGAGLAGAGVGGLVGGGQGQRTGEDMQNIQGAITQSIANPLSNPMDSYIPRSENYRNTGAGDPTNSQGYYANGVTDMNAQPQQNAPNQLVDIKGGNGMVDSIDAGSAFLNAGETMKYPTVYSDSFKIDVELAAQNNLPAWSVGKTPSQISKVIDRKYQGSDRSAKNTKELLYGSLDKASEMYRAKLQEAEQAQQAPQEQMQPQGMQQGPQDGSGPNGQMMQEQGMMPQQAQPGLAYGGDIPPENMYNGFLQNRNPMQTSEIDMKSQMMRKMADRMANDTYDFSGINEFGDVPDRTYTDNKLPFLSREELNKLSKKDKPTFAPGTQDVNFDPTNPNGNMNGFNQYTPALVGYAGQAVGPMYDLTREDRNLDYMTAPNIGANRAQYTGNHVDYGRAIDESNLSALQTKGAFNKMAGNMSTSAGQFLSNVGANARAVGAKNTMANSKILEQQANTNVNIDNKGKQFNAMQANQDNRLDAQLKSKYDQMNYQVALRNSLMNDKLASVDKLGNIVTTGAKDYLKNKAFNNNVGISGTDEYGNLIAKDGSLITRHSAAAGAEYYTYTNGLPSVYVINGKKVGQKKFNEYIRTNK